MDKISFIFKKNIDIELPNNKINKSQYLAAKKRISEELYKIETLLLKKYDILVIISEKAKNYIDILEMVLIFYVDVYIADNMSLYDGLNLYRSYIIADYINDRSLDCTIEYTII